MAKVPPTPYLGSDPVAASKSSPFSECCVIRLGHYTAGHEVGSPGPKILQRYREAKLHEDVAKTALGWHPHKRRDHETPASLCGPARDCDSGTGGCGQ